MSLSKVDFFVVDLEKLPNYGFELAPSGDYYRITFKNATSIVVACETHLLSFLSPCKSCIALMCKMYKNNDVIVVGLE